jgi:hypothetical protein
VIPQKDDFIRFKINIMINGAINPSDRIIDVIRVSEDYFLGYENTKNIL